MPRARAMGTVSNSTDSSRGSSSISLPMKAIIAFSASGLLNARSCAHCTYPDTVSFPSKPKKSASVAMAVAVSTWESRKVVRVTRVEPSTQNSQANSIFNVGPAGDFTPEIASRQAFSAPNAPSEKCRTILPIHERQYKYHNVGCFIQIMWATCVKGLFSSRNSSHFGGLIPARAQPTRTAGSTFVYYDW